MSMTRTRLIPSLLVIGTLCAIVGGCSPFAENEAEMSLRSSLEQYESVGTATVTFGDILDGDWKYVVLVCSQTEPAAVESALGFESALTQRDEPMHSMFIFSTGEQIETYIDSGNTTASKVPWVYPCTPPALQETPQRTPVVLTRDDSVLFVLEAETFGDPLWYIPESEMNVLAGAD